MPSWKFVPSEITNGLHFALRHRQTEATYQQALTWLRDDAEFRARFIECLRSVPFRAYKWETPALSATLSQRAFEFVVIDAPWLDRPADASDFSEHLMRSNGAAVSFRNLANDAELLVPTAGDDTTDYCHLGAFTRTAPMPQQLALWQTAGKMGLDLMANVPTWLSTAGDGVPWLHLRFDSRPKYYTHAKFAAPE